MDKSLGKMSNHELYTNMCDVCSQYDAYTMYIENYNQYNIAKANNDKILKEAHSYLEELISRGKSGFGEYLPIIKVNNSDVTYYILYTDYTKYKNKGYMSTDMIKTVDYMVREEYFYVRD